MKKYASEKGFKDEEVKPQQECRPLGLSYSPTGTYSEDMFIDCLLYTSFGKRLILTEFSVSPGGRFTAWYEDDDMFWGHVVIVEATLKKGPIFADIQG